MSNGLTGVLREKGLLTSFEKQVVALEPALVQMSERGVPVKQITYDELIILLTERLATTRAEMQALVPNEVKKCHVYKRVPTTKVKAKWGDELKQRDDYAWIRYEQWSPSNKGLISYMRFREHKVPTNAKGKDSTAEIEVIRLYKSTGDPLYGKVIEFRKAQTVLTNHMKNWAPGADGRVHGTFYCDPATGQLSCRRPNMQNAPHHDDPEFGGYAEKFRAMIEAPPGHMIVEFDYKSFHVQTLAFEAGDADMLRLAKLDIHSFVTAHFLHLGDASRMIALPDDELREYLAWIKKNHKHTRNAQVKHALLGYNNGMGYNKLYKQYMEFFNNVGEAKRVMQLLDHLFPKAKAYRDSIVQTAHEQGYLISRHGYIRYFWEVFRWQGGWRHGDDHENALCFFTQNDAHGELRERIVTLHERGLDERYKLINTIHDSLMFQWPLNLLDEIQVVKDIMESPSRVLVNSICPKGLSVEVEVAGGPHWSAMKVIA